MGEKRKGWFTILYINWIVSETKESILDLRGKADCVRKGKKVHGDRVEGHTMDTMKMERKK